MGERIKIIFSAHAGKIFGAILGLLLGWIIIRYGVIKGLFVVLCVAGGLYLGARFDSPETSGNIISRFLR